MTEIIFPARLRQVTAEDLARREAEAQEIRNAAPTHQGLTPRTLREAFPNEAEPVLYLDNSLLAKCLRAFDRLLSRN